MADKGDWVNGDNDNTITNRSVGVGRIWTYFSYKKKISSGSSVRRNVRMVHLFIVNA